MNFKYQSIQIGLMWMAMWACMGGLYKLNTGKWPPNPFSNDEEDEEEEEYEEVVRIYHYEAFLLQRFIFT